MIRFPSVYTATKLNYFVLLDMIIANVFKFNITRINYHI